MLELYSVRLGHAAGDATTVEETLSFALEIAGGPNPYVIHEHYRMGLGAYDNWIQALQHGVASDMGVRHSAGVWLECRQNAAAFLKEARERLPGRADGLFDEAA